MKPFGLIIATFLILFLPLFSGCDRKSENNEILSHVHSILETHPDSALSILKNIDKTSLDNKEDEARYSLLMSMALDKNYIDTTTFDIIQPAIDYYLKEGTPDEKMTTYYYQGRIFQNRDEDDKAMLSFLNAREMENITDTLMLARLLVAQATLYTQQYKTSEFISNNLLAAELYHSVNKPLLEIKCFSKALSGAVVLGNKSFADSIITICHDLIENNPVGKTYFSSSYFSYILYFGSEREIRDAIERIEDFNDRDLSLNAAQAYLKLGKGMEALQVLDNFEYSDNPFENIKYLIVKSLVLENVGDLRAALETQREYSEAVERYHYDLFTQDLLFSEERHNLELANLTAKRDKDRIIWISISSVIILSAVAMIIYYRYHLGKMRERIIKLENEKLLADKRKLIQLNEETENGKIEALTKLENEINVSNELRIAKDRMEVEQRNLEETTKQLESEKLAAILERDKKTMEVKSLEFEKSRIKNENSDLKDLLLKQKKMAERLQSVTREREDIFNSLLAKEISNVESYAKPYRLWINEIISNQERLMESIRVVLNATHPEFMKYLISCGLNEEEIGIISLYSLGLRGKDISEYLNSKRHYHVTSAIRKKLNIDKKETNIGIYIKRLMDEW